MEKMLNHLSEESKQAAATTLVSSPPAPALSQSSTAGLGHGALATTANCLVTPTAHQRGRPVPHLLRTPHLGHLQALLPQVMQVSSSHAMSDLCQDDCQPLALPCAMWMGADALSSSVPEPASTST